MLILAGLWTADRALRAGGAVLGLSGPADPAGVPFLLLVLTALGFLVTPIGAAWSRRLEREADRVALDVTRAPDAFVAAMERLGRLNLAETAPGAPPGAPVRHTSVPRSADRRRARGRRRARPNALAPRALTGARRAWEPATET